MLLRIKDHLIRKKKNHLLIYLYLSTSSHILDSLKIGLLGCKGFSIRDFQNLAHLRLCTSLFRRKQLHSLRWM